MTVDFNDYFWGEKNNGFDVLYHNMKFGVVASKELSEFFREKSNIEEQNSKLMTKLAHKAGSGTLNSTFAPVWTILRTSAEKLSALHLQMVQKLTELVKDVAKYADELHKKHKLVKEEESHTLECVQAMQSSTAAVQKSKDLYTTKVLELEKLRKDNGSPKDIEKVESKLKKLQEDYKVLLDKHNPIKTEFERKMTQTCRRFQEIEEVHLRQMKEFLSTYLELVQNNHDMVGQVHSDFKRQFLDMTVDKLLEQFVLNKYTGLEKPERHQESQQQEQQTNERQQQQPQRRTTSLLNIFSSNSQVSGILRSRREKTKTKKLKKKKELEAGDGNKEERNVVEEKDHLQDVEQNKVQKSSSATVAIPVIPGVVPTAAPEVDEDGYSIQPQKEAAWEDNPENAGSFYSDSDSDSDNDKPDKKIHVKIKPLNNGTAPMSASVDELRATVGNISLSPVGIFSHSQQLEQSSIASRQQSPEVSNASTPTATVHPYAPLQSPTLSMSNNSRYADLGDIFSEVGEISASAPASATISKSVSRQIPTPTSANSIAIPRPPSRRSEMAPRGRISPSSMSRADSVGSMEFRMGVGHGSSRGPSPLTIGISDTIPLAVAFHEIIHAYFRGTDESRCQVKITGDMMLSFPAGIAGVLANNPNPARLGFRMKNINNLENIVPNQELVQVDHSQSDMVSTVLEFNMTALTAKLRRQSEQSPSAAYFNVEILKYQVRSKPGASSCPFQLVSYWKCEPTYTALKIDYKYNNHAMAVATPLLNVTLSVPVNGSVRNVQSKPHSAWLGESNRLVWNFTDISQNSQGGGVGTLRARLELNDGPSTPNTMTTQFNCEGTTLSGIEFELIGNGYRQSLVKRRFVSGKYICEGDGIRSGATPTPPSVGSSSPYSAKSN
ncbi:F-BAR domain only protein 2 isoform X6 [Episyrphus balteatus]|uniref:F-BAR domain only protein 2 isoform X6 n=1 Tax=Episyrphus balteatus TaxID=286459 RepID=UPI0024851CD8|nr:F-BAR domain only protein 2 isoform X6 [Episyrphus balteatus]